MHAVGFSTQTNERQRAKDGGGEGVDFGRPPALPATDRSESCDRHPLPALRLRPPVPSEKGATSPHIRRRIRLTCNGIKATGLSCRWGVGSHRLCSLLRFGVQGVCASASWQLIGVDIYRTPPPFATRNKCTLSVFPEGQSKPSSNLAVPPRF